MSKALLVKGHTLLFEGQPMGYRRTGIGHAKCSCGDCSPELDSNSKRKQWHREHKAQVAAERTEKEK